MQAAILTVGEELLAGDTENTNGTWLAGQLTDRGVAVARILAVPDEEGVIAGAVDRYSDTFDAVVVTGGLGGTPDDVTMSAVAAAFDRPLVENDLARADVEGRRDGAHRHVVGRAAESAGHDDGVEGLAVPADGVGDDGLLVGYRELVTAVSHYRIDRPTAGGRTGKQSQQSLSIRATATPRSVNCRASHVPLVFSVSPASSSSPTVSIAACTSPRSAG